MPDELKPEDYAEPRCVLCDEPYGAAPQVKAVPQRRIVEKLDEYMGRRDYAGAERHLLYWLEEARLGGDLRGELMVRNELIGHFRKTGKKEEAMAQIDAAMDLLKKLDYEGSISSGTTYTNAGTACNAFGDNVRAAGYLERARAIYEAAPAARPELLGGLYNNLALTYVSLGRFEEAYALYDKAMAAMDKVPGGVLEQAITCLNRANALEAQLGLEQAESRIFDLLDEAEVLLNQGRPAPGSDAPEPGYYAFVCEKCAPTFGYYGYFAAARELEERSQAIYAAANAHEPWRPV